MTQQPHQPEISPIETMRALDVQLAVEAPLQEPDDQERLQLEAKFNYLASVLERADWPEDKIQAVSSAVYSGVTEELRETIQPQLTTLRLNTTLVDMRESERLLWEQWFAGWPIEKIEAAYHDPDNHSAHKLRMQIAHLVAKIGAQTY